MAEFLAQFSTTNRAEALDLLLVGWLEVPGGWQAVSNWLDPVVPPLVVPSNTQEAVASIVSVALGLVGIGVAWWIYLARRQKAPAAPEALEKKLWFDELYDAVFSRPGQAIAVALRDRFEAPVVQGGLDEVADGTLRGAAVTSEAQTGLVRTYALTITAAVAVLVLVFLVVR